MSENLAENLVKVDDSAEVADATPPWRNGRRCGLKSNNPDCGKDLYANHPGVDVSDSEKQNPSNSGRDKWGHRLADAPVKCETCDTEFYPSAKDARRRTVRFCSNECRHRARKGHAPAHMDRFVTPDSTKAERVRANGLVNKRRKLGWFTVPKTCQKCGQPHHRISAHHEDYSKPDHVHFVCPSCHVKAHLDSGYLAGIAPVVIDKRQDGKPIGDGRIHGKGGRKGPRPDYTALGRHPLRRIVNVTGMGESLTETLACGHSHFRQDDGRRPIQRRCQSCPRSAALAFAREGVRA